MDEGKRLPPPRGRTSASFHWSNDTFAEIWHSTPVKKKDGGASLDAASNTTAQQRANRTPPTPADTQQFPVADLSVSTIQRQRRELQLLMAELKDRDRELNSMAASHHKQLHAWEQDRQRVLSLEQRCSRLDGELQKRNEVIQVLTRRVRVVETREEEVQRELSGARQQLSELQQKQQHISKTCDDFEEQNQSLSSTVMALSTQLGSLQVREEELSSMLKLKDKDVTEASGRIVDLTGRLRDLETSLTESRSRESKVLRDFEENKRRYREARREITHFKEELQQQVTQSSTQREEIIRLKQALQLLRTDLALSGEGDSWKEELLELARSKQERTESELRCLRQVCDNQRNDLQLLQLNLESAREALQERSSQGLPGRQDEFRCVCVDLRPPSPLTLRNSRRSGDAATLPGAARGGPGGSSARPIDDDAPLCSCSLQESRQLVEVSSEHSCPACGHNSVPTTEPRYSHRCQTPPHHQHHPAAPPHTRGQ